MLLSIFKRSPTLIWRGSRLLSSLPRTFEAAKFAMTKLRKEPDNQLKLKIYALYKQATEGACTMKQPGKLDFVKFAKWQAWNELGNMTAEAASEAYINLIKHLLAAEAPSGASSAAKYDASPCEVDRQDDSTGVMRLTLNRPSKKNAITWTMYDTWMSLLNQAAEDSNVKMVVITGAGDYFCSGNDNSNFAAATKPGADMRQIADSGKHVMQKFVASFIDFPKPLVALINGPAVGIAVTTLPLYDCVLASDAATFHAPLTALGMTPEGCASYTFPRTMGSMRTNDMLLFGRKLTAAEALAAGLVTDVFPAHSFYAESEARIEKMAALPLQTLMYAKELLRTPAAKADMHATNKIESDRIGERWTSPDCMAAITAFLTRRAK